MPPRVTTTTRMTPTSGPGVSRADAMPTVMPVAPVVSAAEVPQVTFQEPLESKLSILPMIAYIIGASNPCEPFCVCRTAVVPNEEVYSRMRQQRVMREELREKKRALEQIMHKDRPRKQYSRNQDTHSDNVSNKSDTIGYVVL